MAAKKAKDRSEINKIFRGRGFLIFGEVPGDFRSPSFRGKERIMRSNCSFFFLHIGNNNFFGFLHAGSARTPGSSPAGASPGPF